MSFEEQGTAILNSYKIRFEIHFKIRNSFCIVSCLKSFTLQTPEMNLIIKIEIL